MTRKSLMSLIALLTVVMLVVAACGGDDDDAEPTNTSPSAGGAPTATATAGTGGTAAGEGTEAGEEGTSSESGGGGDLVAAGEELYNSLGCAGCHSTDGSEGVGPSWQGVWGHEVELESGDTVTVDEAYVTESIREPTAKVVKGFTPSMPAFGPDQVSDDDIQAIIAFMQSLSD